MKYLVYLTLLCNFANAQNINDIKVGKGELIQSLNMLKASGKISEEEFGKAVNEVKAMDDKKLNEINNDAKKMINSDPKKAYQLIDK